MKVLKGDKMKAKKYLVWAILIAGILGTPLATTASGQEDKEQTEDIKLLQAKIKDLEKTIKIQEDQAKQAKKTIDNLKKELAEQVEENKKWETLCKALWEEAGIKIEPEGKADIDFDNIVYGGKKRNRRWFEKMYEKFYDKIAYFDGEYIDIGKVIANHGGWLSSSRSMPRGYITKAPWNGKVLSVLENAAVLIHKDGIVWHVHGLERGFVDDEWFPEDKIFICVGTYTYITPLGAQKTVSSFVICKHLTKKQFAEAINRGFKLIEYETIRTGTYIGNYRYTTIEKPIR